MQRVTKPGKQPKEPDILDEWFASRQGRPKQTNYAVAYLRKLGGIQDGHAHLDSDAAESQLERFFRCRTFGQLMAFDVRGLPPDAPAYRDEDDTYRQSTAALRKRMQQIEQKTKARSRLVKREDANQPPDREDA